MAEYTNIETAMAIICDLCECLYPDGYCPEKCDLEKCDWMEHLKEGAADVAPVVHGRWIDRGDYVTTAYGSLPVNRCSECHMDVTLEDFDNYCPNCGARMDGGSENG